MRRKYWVLLIFCVGVLFLDQWTKYLVVQKLPLYQGVEVIQGFFNLTHMRNTGGAFGIFGGEKGGFGSVLFVAVSVIAIGAIAFLFIKIKENERASILSFSFILIKRKAMAPMAITETATKSTEPNPPFSPPKIPKAPPVFLIWVRLKNPWITSTP